MNSFRVSTLFFLLTVADASVAQQSLPPNYNIVLDNPLLQVQRVHYGPHEFVPLHDHYAVPTVLIYLDNSDVVDIAHEDGAVVHRPPTHAGAFRIAPGLFERHSIRNTGDAPSDFFRIELKQLPNDVVTEFRGPAPVLPLTTGVSTVYASDVLRIDRVTCVPAAPCNAPAETTPSLLVEIPLPDRLGEGASLVRWIPAGQAIAVPEIPHAQQFLRLVLRSK